MKKFFSDQVKRIAFAAAIVALVISGIAIHANFVQGKSAILQVAGTAPVSGATIRLTRAQGASSHGTVTATTDANGNFTLSNVEHGVYNMTITPAVTFTTSGRGVLGHRSRRG